jgi:hypothetical protein
VTTTADELLTVTSTGYLRAAPEATILHPLMLAGWTRYGLAVRYCPPEQLRDCSEKSARCPGHHNAAVRPGHRIVLGRPGHPTYPRAVYTVRAVGTAGIRLTREA